MRSHTSSDHIIIVGSQCWQENHYHQPNRLRHSLQVLLKMSASSDETIEVINVLICTLNKQTKYNICSRVGVIRQQRPKGSMTMPVAHPLPLGNVLAQELVSEEGPGSFLFGQTHHLLGIPINVALSCYGHSSAKGASSPGM